MTAHSMVLTRMAECEDDLAREIVEMRKLGGFQAGREVHHFTEAARVCKIRGEALRRMATEAEQRETSQRGTRPERG